MSIAVYMDHHVPRAITLELRRRDVDVLTAFEDGTAELEDPALLDRASELGRILLPSFSTTYPGLDNPGSSKAELRISRRTVMESVAGRR